MPARKVIDTSQSAYKSLQPDQIAQIYRDILSALAKIGEGTMEEIAVAAKLPKERVWKRLSELCTQELIYRPGTKRPLRSGRAGYTWRLTDKSLPKTQTSEKALCGKSVVDYSRKLIPANPPIQTNLF